MAVTYTMTWAGGIAGNPSSGFVLTDDFGNVTPVSYSLQTLDDIKNPVHRAVADELSRQAGSATGTVTVTIS